MFPELLPELAFHLFCRWHFAEHEFANSENLWQGGFHFQKLKPIWKRTGALYSIFGRNEKHKKIPGTQLAKAFNPKLIIAEMCNIPFLHFSLEQCEDFLATFLAAASFQLAQNLDLRQNGSTCVTQPASSVFLAPLYEPCSCRCSGLKSHPIQR